MSIQINLNLSKSKYPMLEKLKVKDRDKVINQIIDIGYNVLYPDFNLLNLADIQKENSKYNSLIELIETNNLVLHQKIEENSVKSKLDEMTSVITKLTGISNTSNKKGELSEKMIEQILQTKFPGLTYEQTRHIPHSGDGKLHFPENCDVLIEIKNYSYAVNVDEVEKFTFDMKFTNIKFGIFLSLQTPIRGILNFDYKQFIHNNNLYHQIFIGCLNQNYDLLNAGIMMVRQLFKIQINDLTILDLFHGQISNYFQEILSLYEKNKQLRENFGEMETNIKNAMSIYYCQLRENQVELENKINQVQNKINKTIDENKLKLENSNVNELLCNLKNKKHWGFEYISKLIDKVEKKKGKISGNGDTFYLQIKNKICEIKIQSLKIIFNFNEPCLTFTLEKKNKINDSTMQLFDKFFFEK